MDRGFRFHEHTADITIECWAPTLEESFEEAAKATFEVILDTTTVSPTTPFNLVVVGIDLQELLVEWIGRLIALIDINGQFYSSFKVETIDRESTGYRLKGTVFGEDIDFSKHDTKTEVKAMTYADMKIERTDETTRLWFTLDL
ncbi:MAG: archease [Candidatus Thorarchaeota archaeon]|nr:archease [Candidatus Thorarchaeota archaeon]